MKHARIPAALGLAAMMLAPAGAKTSVKTAPAPKPAANCCAKVTKTARTNALAPVAAAKKCTGSSSCTACKTCSGCKYCAKDGGSCGVCKKKS